MTTYAVRITGKILDGFERDQVRASLKELFKLTDERVEKFLYGGAVTVKQHLAPSVALKYQKTLNQIGLETEVEREDQAVESESVSSITMPEVKTIEPSNTQPNEKLEPVVSSQIEKNTVLKTDTPEQKTSNTESFDIAPVGAQIGPSKPEAPPPPNVSHLSSSEIGDRLEPEKPPPPPPPNTDHFQLDPVGTALAKPQKMIELNLDLSHLSVKE